MYICFRCVCAPCVFPFHIFSFCTEPWFLCYLCHFRRSHFFFRSWSRRWAWVFVIKWNASPSWSILISEAFSQRICGEFNRCNGTVLPGCFPSASGTVAGFLYGGITESSPASTHQLYFTKSKESIHYNPFGTPGTRPARVPFSLLSCEASPAFRPARDQRCVFREFVIVTNMFWGRKERRTITAAPQRTNLWYLSKLFSSTFIHGNKDGSCDWGRALPQNRKKGKKNIGNVNMSLNNK